MKHTCSVCKTEFFRKGTRLQKYCSSKCYWSTMKGMKPFHYKGGKTTADFGYVLIFMPSHPNCTNDGYMREHRLVMEKHLGRLLKKTEVVHHKNGVTNDNRIENLELFENHSEHLSHERTGRKREPFSKEWIENIRLGRLKWLDEHRSPNS